MQWWKGYGHDTGRLSFAPEFEDDGSWPPVSTSWLALRWELFEAKVERREHETLAPDWGLEKVPRRLKRRFGSRPEATLFASPPPEDTSTFEAFNLLRESNLPLSDDERDVLSPNFLDTIFGKASVLAWDVLTNSDVLPSKESEWPSVLSPGLSYGPQNQNRGWERKEIRRVVHYARWKRKDPVTQLPPGGVQEISYTVTTGLSTEHSQILARSLGLEFGGSGAGIHGTLTGRLEQQFGFRLAITNQEQRTTKLSLTNQSNGYRLFALWQVEDLITVDALAATREQRGKVVRLRPGWLLRATAEFVTNSEPVVTSTDIASRRQ